MVSFAHTVDDCLDIIFAFDILFQCFCGYHERGGQRFPQLHFRKVISFCESASPPRDAPLLACDAAVRPVRYDKGW